MGSEESGCARADHLGQGPLTLCADHQAEALFAGRIAGSFLIRVICTWVKRLDDKFHFSCQFRQTITFYPLTKRRGNSSGNPLKEQMHAVVKTVPGPGAEY